MDKKTKNVLLLAGLGVLAYMVFFRKKDAIEDAVIVEDEPIDDAEVIDEEEEASSFSGEGRQKHYGFKS
tara:strand:+ start:1769 stop:1975 length:207 start_codon:yes stop_codon:yes gene_type:complete